MGKKFHVYKKKSIIISLLFLLIMGGFLYTVISFAGNTEVSIITPPSKDTSEPRGSDANPLFVLEIVPNKSFAEIGYHFAGCEPIDMNKAICDGFWGTYNAIGLGQASTSEEKKYRFELTTLEIIEQGWEKGEQAELRGYYEKLANKTGNFNQVKKGSEYTYELVEPGTGQYRWVTVPGQGWINNIDHTADKVYINDMKTTVYRRKIAHIKHYNKFLIEALHVPEEEINNYRVKVITVDPRDLTRPENLELIEKADIISMSGKSHINALPGDFIKYNKEGLTKGDIGDFTSFEDNDLTWEATMKIFNRLVSKHRPVLILDAGSMYLKGKSENNAHKLSIMTLLMGQENFNNFFVKTGEIKYDSATQKSYYQNKNNTSWDSQTFQTTYGYYNSFKILNPNMDHMSFVMEGVIVYNGGTELTQGFTSKIYNEFNYTQDGFDWYTDMYPDYNLNGKLTLAEAIHFEDWLAQNENTKELYILEIQPFQDFVYKNPGWKEKYRAMLPKFVGTTDDLHITTMSMSEFIGAGEDINSKYDMIYIGVKTDSVSLNYIDTKLNGKAYLAIGDKASGTSSNRLSGNDLTKKKFDELKDYMDSGKPIVLGSGFYTDSTRKKVSAKVDKATYVYDLAAIIKERTLNKTATYEAEQQAYRDNYATKLLYEPNLGTYTLQNRLTANICRLELISYPQSYSYTTKNENGINGLINDSQYASEALSYKFKISGTANFYTLKLFIDINGDGRYVDSLNMKTGERSEEIKNLTVKEANTGTQITDLTQLKRDKEYILQRTLESGFAGSIPWKLEVCSTIKPELRSNRIDYSAIKVPSNKIKKLRVLQVITSSGINDASTVLNLENGTDDVARKFRAYLNAVEGYTITVKTINNVEYLSLANSSHDFSSEYDMIIFGFRDGLSFTNSSNAFQQLEDFIAQGKSVIFTHDTTLTKDEDPSLYTAKLRKLMGQDRYQFNYTMNAATPPYSNQNLYYDEGLAQLINQRLILGENYYEFFSDNKYKLKNTGTGNSAAYNTSRITLMNEAQITNYPYKIGNTINVATTHSQSFQLDLEPKDMVVYFNLSDNQTRQNGGNSKGYYSSTENDSRNSYYLYNKGNVTYTGLGHSASMTDDEIKLFVNTIIASTRNSQAATLEIKNPGVFTGNDEQQYLYVTKEEGSSEITNQTAIYYEVKDEDLAPSTSKNYYVQYFGYIKDEYGNETRVLLNPEYPTISANPLETWNDVTKTTTSYVPSKGALVNAVDTFKVVIPPKYLEENYNFRVEAHLRVESNGVAATSISKINFVVRPLFNLD